MAIKMEIVVNDRGELTVTGPIDNPIMSLGILEAAKDVVRNHNAAKARLVRAAVIPGQSGNGAPQ